VVIGTSDRSDIDFSLKKYDEISDLKINSKQMKRLKEANFSINQAIAEDPSNFMIKQYRETVDTNAVNCLISLGNFLVKSSSDNINHFFQSLNNSYDSLNLFGHNFKRKEKVNYLIRYFLNKNLPDIPYAITTSIANNLVLLTLKEHLRNNFDQLTKFISENLNFDITYPFISWLDGWEEDGVNIEQWQRRGIFSEYLPKNTLYIKQIQKMSQIIDLIATISRENDLKKYDIFFDCDDNKIYISGEKISSNNLPTVTRTLELLEKIFEHADDFTIANSELSSVSYFQDRNELQSKIISPLKILIQKKFGKLFNLKITGGLREFKVSYFPSNVRIGLLKRT